jgi:hypothetical protein
MGIADMINRLKLLAGLLVLLAACSESQSPAVGETPLDTGTAGMSRTAAGNPPDLSGFYDVATLTPLQRPKEYGTNLYLSVEEAEQIAAEEAELSAERDRNRGPASEAPPSGGAPPIGLGEEALEESGAGSVGGYNQAYVDRGNSAFMLDGKFRTSIITEPENGRMPGLTPAALAQIAARRGLRRRNTGDAWWVTLEGPGPYDGPESLGDSERCLTGFGSTGGPPMLPVLYNNMKRIVQTDNYVMILIEMVHDARIIRLNAEHAPAEVRLWYGDSIGKWEGDTLVVDTTNFTDNPALFLASRNLHVVERFQRTNENDILYSFTVEDPTVWQAPWSGEYLWPGSEHRVYEYACHEGNYSMASMLRGARILEEEALAAAGDD